MTSLCKSYAGWRMFKRRPPSGANEILSHAKLRLFGFNTPTEQ